VRRTPAVLALTFALESAGAQIIRGVVTESVSGLPLAGVLVSSASVPDSLRPGGIRNTLTNERGEYALRLSSGGRYIISAKRIGVARHNTSVLTLQQGEARRVDLVLEPFQHQLPVVMVVDVHMCVRRSEERQQITALWDEVRTALLATGVSRQERLLTGWLSKYQRTLEPKSLRILDDRRTVAEGFFDRPMKSISADSLQKVGYWYKEDEETMVFHGPDEEVLLSPAFRAGHCFELLTGRDATKGFVGLAFQPRRPNLKGGIEGTLWLDAGTFELRFIEFRYDIMTIPPNPHIGGQVHYVRLPSGAWLVRRWFLRMPQFPGQVSSMPTVWRLIEEGGGLYTPGLRSWETPGRITGVVTDSTGRHPLRETVVALSGTPFSVQVDSSGRFRFDSIAPGAYTLLASHPAYADFGQLADEEPLTVETGTEFRASLRAITTTQLRAVVCDAPRAVSPIMSRAQPPSPDKATVRMLFTNADGTGPVSRLHVWLRWRDAERKTPINPLTLRVDQQFLGVQSATDNAGGVTFCDVPPKTVLELVMLRSADDPTISGGERVVGSFMLERGDVALKSFQVAPPK
jgi:hypothetical protein